MLDFQTSFSFRPSRISIQSPARLHLPLPSSVRCTCPHFFHRPRLALHLPRSSSANLNAHIIVVLGARDDETVRTGSEWRALQATGPSLSSRGRQMVGTRLASSSVALRAPSVALFPSSARRQRRTSFATFSHTYAEIVRGRNDKESAAEGRG